VVNCLFLSLGLAFWPGDFRFSWNLRDFLRREGSVSGLHPGGRYFRSAKQPTRSGIGCPANKCWSDMKSEGGSPFVCRLKGVN
jgi:hypothetical protein